MSLLHVSSESFKTEVLESNIPVLVDFFADWCGPCKMIAPIVEELAEDFSDTLKVVKLNIDEAEEIAREYSVMSIPTLILFDSGEPHGSLVGFRSKEAIVDELGLR